MAKTIIFDFDGVIVDSVDVKTNAFRELFKDYAESEEIVNYHKQNMGVSRYVKFEHIYKNILRLPFSDDVSKELDKKFSGLVMDAVVNCPYVNGAREFIRDHYRSINLYIASGTPNYELKEIVKMRGLMGYFRGVYGSHWSKSGIIKYIMKKDRLRASDIVFVGDAMSDYNESVKARVDFIGMVKDGNSPLFEIDAVKVHDFLELSMVL